MINSVARVVRLLDASGPRAIAGAVLAVVLWAVFIDGFVDALSQRPKPVRPLTLDARVVEIPPPLPAAPPAAPAARPATHAPSPARPTPTLRHAVRSSPPAPAPVMSHDETPAPSAPAAPPAAGPTGATGDASAAAASQAGSPSPAVSSVAAGNSSAHPLVQPLPVLPEDLREYAYQAVALARFSIHPDGSVDVTLVRPTQNPRLNQLLLETLKNWRFFPAMKAGRPVESEQDIRVHFNVG